MIGFLVELFSQVGFLSCVAKFSSSVSENLKVNLLNERSFIELIFPESSSLYYIFEDLLYFHTILNYYDYYYSLLFIDLLLWSSRPSKAT